MFDSRPARGVHHLESIPLTECLLVLVLNHYTMNQVGYCICAPTPPVDADWIEAFTLYEPAHPGPCSATPLDDPSPRTPLATNRTASNAGRLHR